MPRLYWLKNKAVLKFGNHPEEFLKNFSTNTPDSPKNAFVNIEGRIVATFDQTVLENGDVQVVMERQFVGRLKNHLDRYIKLTDATLEETEANVYMDLNKDPKPIITREKLEACAPDSEFTLFRLKNNLPIQGIDYDEEMLLNLDDENLVSYTKGCYLGQEVVARVRFRSKPPKKLVVKFEAECTQDESLRMTSKALDLKTGKTLGFVFVRNEG